MICGLLVVSLSCQCCAQDVVASNDTRAAIGKLRQILLTPVCAYSDTVTDEVLSGDSSVTGHDGGVTGRRSSESDCLSDADLPGLITRVLGKREQLHCPCFSSKLHTSFNTHGFITVVIML